MLLLAAFGTLLWIIILLLPWRPWSTKERLDAIEDLPDSLCDLNDVTVLIPARNEESVISQTLDALKHQGPHLSIVLVDDNSTDQTAERAKDLKIATLKIVRSEPLPEGWAGKLWALEQGLKHVKTDFVLLLDADITLKPKTIPSLKNLMLRHQVDFLSLMAKLEMKSFWEKLLIPSFIYFFKLLYPFSLGNSPHHKTAVAAGGFILTRTKLLHDMGGFAILRDALIDDCSLAKAIKSRGHRTWMGLTQSVTSHRSYSELGSIWKMVSRSAFTQLRYSSFLLLVTSILMLSLFLGPVGMALLSTSLEWKVVGLLGFVSMIRTYRPTLTYYQLNFLWSLFLPIIGVLYLLMTWTSAINFWLGRKAEWKGRIYSRST